MDFLQFEPGALISYWDTSYSDNNVGDHPGGGEILPVDAHPNFIHSGTSLMRTKVQTVDSTFSLEPTKADVASQRRADHGPLGVGAAGLQRQKTWWYDCDEHGSGDHPGFYEPEWMGSTCRRPAPRSAS